MPQPALFPDSTSGSFSILAVDCWAKNAHHSQKTCEGTQHHGIHSFFVKRANANEEPVASHRSSELPTRVAQDSRLRLCRAKTMVVTDHSGCLGQIRPRCDAGKSALEVLGASYPSCWTFWQAGGFRPCSSQSHSCRFDLDAPGTFVFGDLAERAATHVLTKRLGGRRCQQLPAVYVVC